MEDGGKERGQERKGEMRRRRRRVIGEKNRFIQTNKLQILQK